MNTYQSIAALLLGSLAVTAQDITPAPDGSRPVANRIHDAEGMYSRAAMMLEDRSIQNVSSVPAMLEACSRAGHLRATLLLLDVYEGKYKGLTAQPQKAAQLAYTLVTAEATDEETAAARALRLEAMYRRAIYYERGYGCSKSAEDAFSWMYRAATEGLGKARVELARYLMNGKGHKAAPKLALALLQEQAKKNPQTPHLFSYLGHMYFYGLGLPRPDRKKARRCYEYGTTLGDPSATNNLATMYERGIAVTRNTALALRLYRQAAAAGNREASVNMQRLGYKVGEAAGESATPYSQRVDNAGLRLLSILPLPDHLRELLSGFFREENKRAPHP